MSEYNACTVKMFQDCIQGKLDEVQNYLETCSDPTLEVNEKHPILHSRETPLFFAVEYGRLEVAKLLLKYGANVHTPNMNGISPILIAASGEVEMVELLLNHGASVNKLYNHCGDTKSVLKRATQHGKTKNIKLLLSRGAKIDHPSLPTLLRYPIVMENMEMLSMLLEYGADVNKLDYTGESALHHACEKGRLQFLDKLLQNGADIDRQNSLGETPLYIATRKKEDDVVRHLLNHGANVNRFSNNGVTPWMLPRRKNFQSLSVEVYDTLMSRIDINYQEDSTGDTLLHKQVSQSRYSKTMKRILKDYDANPNVRNHAPIRNAPLHIAAQHGQQRSVEALVSFGAELDPINGKGETPLLLAAVNKHLNVVFLLLRNGGTCR